VQYCLISCTVTLLTATLLTVTCIGRQVVAWGGASHQALDVLGGVVHHCVSWEAVAAGAGAFLVQRVHRFRYRVVDHETNCIQQPKLVSM